MAYRLQANFAGGELDPALRKRITLNKYGTGLATGRNVIIGKTGRVVSRPAKKYIKDAGNLSGGSITLGADAAVLIHPMPWKVRYMEFGVGYVQVYEADGTVVGQDTHSIPATEFDDLIFVNVKVKNSYNTNLLGGDISYEDGYATLVINRKSNELTYVVYDDGNLGGSGLFFYPPSQPTVVGGTSTYNGTGYNVDYVVTAVVNGEESAAATVGSGGLPDVANRNTFTGFRYTLTSIPDGADLADTVTEMRVYRRPTEGGAYGYIGSTSDFTVASPNITFSFVDYGQEADFTNQPPALTSGILEEGQDEPDDLIFLLGGAGAMYQGRFVYSYRDKILFSRPGIPGNFFRDFPLNSASALTTNIQGDGTARILHFIENDGLIAFTTDGIHVHRGLVTLTNLGFDKKADNVIDFRVPPLNVPGGTIFVDSESNSVKQLRYSDEKNAYIADELSIFSDHLFRDNRITSWAFDKGVLQMLWVTFADGTYASFTYDESQEMKAWTRHDSGVGIERVMFLPSGFNNSDEYVDSKLVFITKESAGTQRWVEHSVPRFLKAETLESNPEADKGEVIAAMDSMVSWSELLNDDLTDDNMTLTPVVADTWDGELTLAVTDDAIFPSPGAGAVGTIFRHFHPVDRTSVDLEITARTNDNEVTVQPSAEFPSAYATNPRLYKTQATFTGLDHMDGENVAVIVDGYVISSPNNDEQNYPTSTPASGSLTLPNSMRGAIVHIGRPYVMDVETLDVHSVEQRPTYNESVTVNKVYVEVYESRGLYVNGRFPKTDLVEGSDADKAQGRIMKPLDTYEVDYEDTNPIIGNRYDQPQSKEFEITLPGDWKSNGKVCLRQVDPIHFEILSIIPDVDDQRR